MVVAEDREERLERILRLLRIARETRDWDWFDRLKVEYSEIMRGES